jgi:transposase
MNEATRNEIIRRWRAGASQRAIASVLGLARGTVRRALEEVAAAREGQTTGPVTRRVSLLDEYEAVLKELLERYPDMTVVRVLQELRARGYQGGYTIVRQRVGQLRPRPTPAPVIRFETGPGVQAQMDYATYTINFTEEGRRRVHLFSYLLGYSRRQYLRFVEAQDFETTLRQHVCAFEHLGGVAASCLYDNLKVVVCSHEDDAPVYNPRFLAFASHYGFRPIACRPRRPQTKGKVERPFHYAENNLLNGRTFHTLAQLNEVTQWWLANVADVRIHAQTRQSPLARHAEELPHLIALPATAYEVAPVVYRTVTVEGFITYRQNLYSVPWRHIGQLLPARLTQDEIIVYGPQLEEVARHRLLPRSLTGQRCECAEHRPAIDARQRQVVLRERFTELGPLAVRFLEGLIQAQRYGTDQAHRVLALLGTYTRADVVAALERAVRYGAYSLAAVERILARQARPKDVLEGLAEEERRHLPPGLASDPIGPRPTSDYQPLLPEEPHDDGPSSETSRDDID